MHTKIYSNGVRAIKSERERETDKQRQRERDRDRQREKVIKSYSPPQCFIALTWFSLCRGRFPVGAWTLENLITTHQGGAQGGRRAKTRHAPRLVDFVLYGGVDHLDLGVHHFGRLGLGQCADTRLGGRNLHGTKRMNE